MSDHPEEFNAGSVRAAWNEAADAYAEAQSTGLDHYRLDFFGPAQLAYSGPIRPAIPIEAGHPFRWMSATHSGAFRPPPGGRERRWMT